MASYERIGITDVVYVDPMKLCFRMGRRSGRQWFKLLIGRPKNFINANLFNYSPLEFIGWAISEGKVLHERHEYKTWRGNPKGTLIVYKNGKVEAGWKWDSDIAPVVKDIWFCCQGFNLFPDGMDIVSGIKKEGFSYSQVGYATDRLSIGYNSILNKVIIAVRPSLDAGRAVTIMLNLGCKDNAICLDSGGSVNLVVNGKQRFLTDRQLPGIITWS